MIAYAIVCTYVVTFFLVMLAGAGFIADKG